MMAKGTTPLFTQTARIGMAQVSAANANLDGTGTIVAIVAGVAGGTRIDLIRVKAEVTTTAGTVRLFLKDATNTWLWAEIDVDAVTPASSTASFSAELVPTDPLVLPDATWSLQASTEKAETFTIFAFGGDFE